MRSGLVCAALLSLVTACKQDASKASAPQVTEAAPPVAPDEAPPQPKIEKIVVEGELSTPLGGDGVLLGSYDRRYVKAMNFLDNYSGQPERLTGARELLENMLLDEEVSPLAYAGLARLAYKAGYLKFNEHHPDAIKKARTLVDKALKIDKKSYEAYLIKAHILIIDEDYFGATQRLQVAESLRPNSADTVGAYLVIEQRKKNWPRVKELAETLLDVAQGDFQRQNALQRLLDYYRAKGDEDKVEAFFMQQMKDRPDSAWTRTNFASYLVKRSRFDEAIKYAEEALSMLEHGMAKKVLADAYSGKAKSAYSDKKYERAKDLFSRATEAWGHEPEYYMGLAACEFEIGIAKDDKEVLKQALGYTEMALRIDPRHRAANLMKQKIQTML